MKNHVALVLLFVLCCSTLSAKEPATLDPKKADADFPVQGEYVGKVNSDGQEVNVGIQIIALGDGKFDAVGYIGGLPGAGWDKSEKHQAKGERDGERVVIRTEHSVGVLEDGVLSIRSSDGAEAGEFKKTERRSPTLGKKAPEGATVLFDGSGVDHWKNGRMTEDGKLMQGTTSLPTFQDHQLHIEFLLPYQPTARGQGRGNSGLYLQGRYEVQMLDSFGLEGKHNECGGIYSIKDPDVNMCLPPLAWQTYDVDFKAAKYKDGKVVANPRMTVRHNGVVIHDDLELPKSTTASPMKPGPEPGPIYLQDHSNPVRYRNIWVLPTDPS